MIGDILRRTRINRTVARTGYEVIRVRRAFGKATGDADFLTGFVTTEGQSVGPAGALPRARTDRSSSRMTGRMPSGACAKTRLPTVR